MSAGRPGPLALALLLAAGVAAAEETAPPAALPDPLAAGWRGERVCERLHEDAEQRVLRCTFPPAVGHERHYHPRHFGYALAGGRMRITDATGTREVEIATGSSFASEGVPWHEVENVGVTTAVFLIVEPRGEPCGPEDQAPATTPTDRR